MSRSQEDYPASESTSQGFVSIPFHNAVQTDPRIQAAIFLIHNNVNVTVAAVARSVNLSPSRFRHLFTNEVGLSIGSYIRLMRLARAQVLLTTTFLSVKEISGRVGVNDVSHFVRDYKTQFGLTPTQERTRNTKSVAREFGLGKEMAS